MTALLCLETRQRRRGGGEKNPRNRSPSPHHIQPMTRRIQRCTTAIPASECVILQSSSISTANLPFQTWPGRAETSDAPLPSKVFLSFAPGRHSWSCRQWEASCDGLINRDAAAYHKDNTVYVSTCASNSIPLWYISNKGNYYLCYSDRSRQRSLVQGTLVAGLGPPLYYERLQRGGHTWWFIYVYTHTTVRCMSRTHSLLLLPSQSQRTDLSLQSIADLFGKYEATFCHRLSLSVSFNVSARAFSKI